MTENKEPQLEKPINDDIPSKEEIVEKPYFDDNSAPTVQNSADDKQVQIQNSVNNPSPYYNPNNNQLQCYPPPDNPQQVDPLYPGATSLFTSNKLYQL